MAASGTTTKRVMVELQANPGNVEEVLDKIKAQADELEAKHPELKVQIDKAMASAQMKALRDALKAEADKPIEQEIKPEVKDDAAKLKIDGLKKQIDVLRMQAKGIPVDLNMTDAELKIAGLESELKGLQDAGQKAGNNAGQSAGGGMAGGIGMMGPLIGTAVVAVLAGLPAIAGGAGALAGIALGTKLLVGTAQVKGPLYNQFTELTHTLLSVMRLAALPLLKPLADAFAQIGTWAKALFPVIRAVFASLGPLVAPLARGLEGLVSGVLPGFLNLMRAAKPAVQSLAGFLAQFGAALGGLFQQLIPGIQASSQFMTGLGGTISSLLPFIGTLASDLAKLLAPILGQIGSTLMPQLTTALDNFLNALAPILPPLGKLIVTIAGFNDGPMVSGLNAVAGMLVQLQGPIQTVLGMLQNLVSWAATAFSWLSRFVSFTTGGMINLGGGMSGSGAGFGGDVSPGLSGPELGSPGSAYNNTYAGYGGGAWASGVPGSTNTGTGNTRPPPANLGLIIAQGLMAQLTGSASQVQGAISKLLGAVNTDVAGKYLTQKQGTAISKWLEADQGRLVGLANRRAAILARIQQADAYAKQVTASTESTFSLTNAAANGPFGGPQHVGTIIWTLDSEVRRIRSFVRDIKKLQKMGLNKAYLDQLIQAGPVQGGAIADELASTGLAEIRQINTAESQIAKASIGLGQTAADAMYDSGKQAGRGFLSGLQGQVKAIAAIMKHIADILVQTIKRELKIASPSQVMRDHGFAIGQGLALGIADSAHLAAAEAQRMTRALVPGPGGYGLAGAGGGVLRVEWVGGSGADQEFITWLKKHIRIRGGDPGVLGR